MHSVFKKRRRSWTLGIFGIFHQKCDFQNRPPLSSALKISGFYWKSCLSFCIWLIGTTWEFSLILGLGKKCSPQKRFLWAGLILVSPVNKKMKKKTMWKLGIWNSRWLFTVSCDHHGIFLGGWWHFSCEILSENRARGYFTRITLMQCTPKISTERSHLQGVPPQSWDSKAL